MLNLLPHQQKKELRLNLWNQTIVGAVAAVIFMILIGGLLLLVTQSFLNINLDELERELTLWQSKAEIKELESLEKKVRELNRELIFLDGLQKEQVRFSLFLENLAEDVPSGIRFDDISIKESNVSLRGYALTRDILLTFKNTLESAPYVSNFDFPLSNLVKTTDINFNLSFQLVK